MSAGKKLLGDSIVNFASFGLLGVAGLAVNYVVARQFGPAGLGTFNFAYSVYILLSQIAVGGCHLAILRYAAMYEPDSDDGKIRFRIALIEAVKISLVTAGLFGAALLVGYQFGMEKELAVSLLWTVPALLFFSISKCCINYFNGIERLKTVGFLNSGRALMMMGFTIIACQVGGSAEHAVATFLLTEVVLAAICLVGLGCAHIGKDTGNNRVEEIRHEVRGFGWRAMPGNIMADVNSRVDVLMLGLLTNKVQTGLYSLPGMLLDGLFHFTVVLRTIVNGKLGRAQSQGDVAALKKLFKIGVLMSFGVTLPMAAVIYFTFPLIIRYGGLDPSFIAGQEPFLILMVLFCLASGFLPFVMAPNQFGMPGRQTTFFAIVFGSNVIGNLVLIPLWGIKGAALATGISFLVYGGLVIGFFRKHVFNEKK